MKKYISEFIGTMVLVLFGCGVAPFCGAALAAVVYKYLNKEAD